MGYRGMCRCEGYGFQAVYSRIGGGGCGGGGGGGGGRGGLEEFSRIG